MRESLERARDWLLDTPDEVPPAHVYARAALLALVAFYGFRLARMDIPSWEMAGSLIHLPMVPIHEFGHILFRPFGEFMTNLGGALLQCALPLVFGGILLVKNRDPFGAAVMLWWSGVAVMDTAPYVYDAFQPQHVLLTGRTGDTGAHDFIDVLGDLGLLMKAQPIARGVHAFGASVTGFALMWGAVVVWLQFARRR
ncbi:MAG: zinc ribbon domain-containing protein [Betaproteobacteria bacterium]|nr:MAG: zinc ribbon domain-containing protein [Betaproteobacteria bacterium]